MTSFAPMMDLGEIATGRTSSYFECDYDANLEAIRHRLSAARVLVIGGGGSIGGEVVRLLARFSLDALHVVDINESALAELVRDLRSSGDALCAGDIRFLPLDFGETTMYRLIRDEPPYDYVLNFAAMKHVRSEKDVYSVMRILSVNVLMQQALLECLKRRAPSTAYFSVSTDKAANPVNLMGASKRLMEHVMFAEALSSPGMGEVTSARFANVAFSEGSLLQSWVIRMSKSQPLAVPRATRRFFVSVQEAGQLCMIAAFVAPSHRILIPRMSPNEHLVELEHVAAKFVRKAGFEPIYFDDENQARQAVQTNRAGGRYPVLLTPLDTTGEKPFEEFVGQNEIALDIGLRDLAAVPYDSDRLAGARLNVWLARLRDLIASRETLVTKDQLVEMVSEILGNFAHVETGKKLDERM
jgi:FlaA1/EpsC-like NDP-sugar epimerase